jgi:hypothetical protein
MMDSTMTKPTGETSQWETLKGLLPLLWPKGRPDLKARVVFALLLLVASKVITVLTPYAFKWATDGLAASKGLEVALLSVPFFMVLAYGSGRIMGVVFAQMRDAVFAKVGQRAVRELSFSTFRHLHALSLKFHLERRTGGLSRIICMRGTGLFIWLDLCGRNCGHGDCLSLVHLLGHGTPHWHQAHHEQCRQ